MCLCLLARISPLVIDPRWEIPLRRTLPMGPTIDHQDAGAGSADELKGLDILLVEDSRDVGDAVKMLLELCGAHVDGPAVNTAEAERLFAAHRPDVALVDFHLRGGEESSGLITRLRQQGVPVIVLSGSFGFGPVPSVAGATFLEKPVAEADLLAHLNSVHRQKRGLEGDGGNGGKS